MARTEVLDEWFFPAPVRRNGHIVPAPEAAVGKYQELKNGWYEQHPNLPHEIPIVSLSPSLEEGQEGYFVRTEIMYQ